MLPQFKQNHRRYYHISNGAIHKMLQMEAQSLAPLYAVPGHYTERNKIH